MFIPWASAVWYEKWTITSRPTGAHSTPSSRPCRVVPSASVRSAGRSSGSDRAKSHAAATSSNTNTGETTFASRTTRTVTPPARVRATMPRSYDRTSAPSVVASGT